VPRVVVGAGVRVVVDTVDLLARRRFSDGISPSMECGAIVGPGG
jgi:hypothetical protein